MAAATVEKAKEQKGDALPQPTPRPKQSKYRFKLLFGMYVSTTYDVKTDPETGQKIRTPINTTYQADPKKGVFPVIHTDIDLEEYNGQMPHMKKFQKVIGSDTQTIIDPTIRLEGESVNAYLRRMEDMVKSARSKADEMLKGLDKMTQDELLALAGQEEIDVSACKTIGDVRQIIRESLTS